jgi:putative membrane protein insertion efficiency factor
MGHCDSSTQLGSQREICSADGRPAEIASEKEIGIRPRSAAQWVSLFLVRFYQVVLGPFFGGTCKFYPSCSRYAYEAIARHGARRGIFLALKRLGRCHPFTKGGVDPVPDVTSEEPRQ